MPKSNSRAEPAATGSACLVTVTREQAENKGLAWVIGAFLICPCHLPLTMALAGTVLAGTTAGVLLRAHPVAAGALITAAWAVGTWRGIHLMRAAQKYAASR
jgi:hypothetical protein